MSAVRVCELRDIDDRGALGFTAGDGAWPVAFFVVRLSDSAFGYLNRCPHAGHPLNWMPNRFFDREQALLLCASHGAAFEPDTGLCVGGPCLGDSLVGVPVEQEPGGALLLDPATLARHASDQAGDLRIIRRAD